jgi:hypothetical protein
MFLFHPLEGKKFQKTGSENLSIVNFSKIYTKKSLGNVSRIFHGEKEIFRGGMKFFHDICLSDASIL